MISASYIQEQRVRAIEANGKSIVYRLFVSDIPNLKTGDTEAQFTEVAIEHSLVSGLNKTPQGSVRKFRFLASLLTRRPDRRDEIVYSGRTFNVVDEVEDQNGYVYEVVGLSP